MAEDGKIPAKLVGIIRKYAGRKVTLHSTSRLFHDLGISGDDAFEFFRDIAEQYGVDTSNFSLKNYFPGEGEASGSDIFGVLFGKRPNDFAAISIAHIIDVISKGRWHSPDLSG